MATIPGSITLSGYIAPSDTADSYAVTDETYNRGGYRTVASLIERNAITADRRKEGMLVKVLSDSKFYTLSGGISDGNWTEQVMGGGSGSTTFIALTDTPATYTGQALKGVRVNSTSDALEFADLSAGGTVTSVSSANTALTITNPNTAPVLTIVSAPKLTTARNINGVAFDGTANITVTDTTKVIANAAITGATKTKVTYDTKGLVTSGADATTADIADSTNKRYVTDAHLTVLGNTSNTNTGDNATNTQYSSLVTNATHTGDVTGSNALTIDKTAITGKTTVTPVGTDYILISDTSDTGNLKKVLISDIQGGAGTITSVTGTAPIVSSGGTTPAISITAATTTVAGSMSATDKTKLDGIATGATANVGTVTSVAAITLGTTGADLSSTVATGTTTPVITLNVPTASATNRGVLSSTDWSTFNNKSNLAIGTTGTTAMAGNTVIPTVGSWGALNYPPWASGTPFVKMTAAGTFTLDTNTYVTGTPWTSMGYLTSLAHNLTGDVSGSYAANTVNKINGVALSTLATGILKNTTTSGAPSIATGADLPVMTSTIGGAVPTPPNNTTTFLRGDGTFAIPTGSGDVVGPTTATGDNIAVFNSTTGKIIKDGGSKISDLATTISVSGKKVYHGVVARPIGAGNPLPTTMTTTTFTLGATANPISYYYQGTLVAVTTNKTATLTDGTAGLYYVYFNAATGNILATKNFPGLNINSNVIIAIVCWNGTNYGLVYDERHSYTRDNDWHEWAHNTVGVRYQSGITLTHNGGTGAAATFAVTSGNIYDEDINFIINAQTTGRLWYQTGVSTYAFVNALSAIPGYLGINNRPNIVNSTGYTLTQVASAVNRYVNVFVYASTDLTGSIYFMTETVTNTVAGAGGYTSLVNARAIPFPNLSNTNMSPELKPIYRLIWRADGVLQAIDTALDDYRLVSSLPQGAGTTSVTASSVGFTAIGNIASTNVQSAIEELDTEKVNTTTTINGLDLSTNRNLVESLGYAMSDNTSDITAGVKITSAAIPYNFTLTGVRAQVGIAAVGALLLTLEIKKNTVSIFTNRLTFDSTETITETATTPYSLTSATIPLLTSDTIELSVYQAGGPTTAAKNLTLFLIGYKS